MSFVVEIPSIFTKSTQLPIRLGNTMLTGSETIQGSVSVNGSLTLNDTIVSDSGNIVYYDSFDISNLNVGGNATISGPTSSDTITTNNLELSDSYIHSNGTKSVNIVNNNSGENSAGIVVNSDFSFLNTNNERNLIDWFSTRINRDLASISIKSYNDSADTNQIGINFKTRYKWVSNSTRLSLKYDGTIECVDTALFSDDRIKTNEQYISNALQTITKLRPQTYNKYNTMDGSGSYRFESGLVAQEIYYDVPELRHLVHSDADISGHITSDDPSLDPDYSNWGPNPASVNYIGLIPYCIQAIKEQQDIIREQQDMIYEKKKKNNELLSRIQALENT